MRKKGIILSVLALIFLSFASQAQTYLNEDFESVTSDLPAGWVSVGPGSVTVQTMMAHGGSHSLRFEDATSNVVALPELSVQANNTQVSLWTRAEGSYQACGTFQVGYLTNVNDASTFVAVETISYADYATYQHLTVSMNTAPAGARIAFRHCPAANMYWWFCDDVVVEPLPSCMPVTNVTAVSTTNSITLSWTDVFNTNNYTVYDMATGSVLASGISAHTYTVQNLVPSTAYTFGVVSNCSATETSAATVISANTTCLPYTAPFIEGFEGGTMPTCWTQVGDWEWSVGAGDEETAIGAHTGTHNIKVVSSDYSGSSMLMTPVIDLSGLSGSAQLMFWHIQRSWAGDNDTLKVYYRTSQNSPWVQLANYPDPVENWTEELLSLPNVSATYQIAFEFCAHWGYGVAIDDIFIGAPSSCASVTNLTATPTSNSVTLHWTDNNNTGATYGILNMVDNISGYPVVMNFSGNTYTVTGLTPSTSYTFAVTVDCPDVEEGSMPTFVTVQTDCGAVPMPFDENFNSLTSGIPVCWSNSEGTTTYASHRWKYYANGHTGAGLRFNSFANEEGNTNILATPPIIVSENAQLAFWCKNPTGGDLTVLASVDASPTRHTLISNLIGLSEWTQFVIPLDPATYTGHTVTVYFQATSNFGNGDAYIYLDDVSVEAQSSSSPCSFTLPYSYDFESAADMDCWTVISDQSGTGRTMGSITYNSSPGTYLFNFEAGTTAQLLISPELRGTSNGVMVSFAFSQGHGTDYFEVGYSYTSTSLSSFTWIEAEDNGSQTVQFYSHTFPAGIKYIAIRYNPQYQYGLRVDDFSFEVPPTCQSVTYLQGSYSYNSMTLTWHDDRNSGATYTVYDMSDNTVVASGITNMTYTVTGLLDRTTYTFGVAANCSATDESEIVTHTHSTRCAPTTIPYVDDMGSGDFVECWMTTYYNTNNFTAHTTYDGRSVLAFGSFNQAENGGTNYHQYAYSPLINSGDESGNMHLRIVYSTYGNSDPLYFGYTTVASDSPNDYSWAGPFYTNGYNDWTTYMADIPANVVQLAIHYGPSGMSNRAFVDHIELTGDCSPMSIPYTENFENCEATSYIGSINTMPMPACWDQFSPTASIQMYRPHVYENAGYAHSGSNSLMMTGSSNVGNAESYALLPQMSVPLNQLQLDFWLNTMNEYGGYLVVGYVTGDNYTSFNALQSYHASSQTVSTVGGCAITLNLANVPAVANRLAFKWIEYSGYSWGCFIDDISIDYAPAGPACELLQNGGVVDSWSDQVDLYWEDPNGGTSYTLLQFTPEATSLFTELASNFVAGADGHVGYTVTGLTPNTQYDFLVVGQCPTTGTMDTVGLMANTSAGSLSFVTVCEDYMWHNSMYDATGEYYSRNDTLRLTVIGIVTIDTTVCTNENSYTWYDIVLTEADDYQHYTYDSETGCDIIEVLHLRFGCCSPVTNLTIDSVTETSVSLSWNGTAASYTVMNGTTPVATGISDTHYTVTGLTAGTNYTFSVIANCSATVSSDPESITVTTDCGVAAVPYNEGFEGYDAVDYFGSVDLYWLPQPLPTCWEGTITTDLNNDPSHPEGFGEYYSYKPHVVTGPGLPYSGGSQSLELVAASHSSTYALLPQLARPLNELQMDFWMATNYYATGNAIFTVGYVTDNNTNTFTAIETCPATAATEVSFAPFPGGVYKTINLSSLPATASRLAFKWENTADNTTSMLQHPLCFIDDIQIDEIPACLPVTDLAIDSMSTTTVSLSWNGTAASYTVMNGTDQLVTGLTDTYYTIAGLTAATNYTISVIANCSATESSDPVVINAITDSTHCDILLDLGVLDVWSDQVDLHWIDPTNGGINYTLLQASSDPSHPYQVVSSGLHADPTGVVTVTITNLIPGTSYTFAVAGNCTRNMSDTVEIVIATESTAFHSVSACHIPYEWHGEEYTLPGEYYSRNDTLHLDVLYGDTTVIACGSFDWYEHTNITTSGEYIHVFTNATGCDSLVVLYLTITECCGTFPIPYTENFEADGDYDCWTVIANSEYTHRWDMAGWALNGTGCFVFGNSSNPPQYLISPELTGTGNGVQVSFSYKALDNHFPESFMVGYSTTTNNPAAFVWDTEMTNINNPAYELYLKSFYVSGIKYVAVKYTASDMVGLIIDHLEIQESPLCYPVINLVCTDTTTTSVTLQWDDPYNTDVLYSVSYDPGNLCIVTDSNITTTSHTVTGLTPNTTYTFIVRTMCSNGYTGSEIITVTTLPIECYPLVNLMCTDTTATSVTLQWEDPDNDGAFYKIICMDELLSTIVIDSVTTTSYVVTGLTPNTAYMFIVLPVCRDTTIAGISIIVETLTQISIATLDVTTQWNLYPNPANTVVTVKAEGMRRVMIYDATGREVENRNVNGDTERFDVSSLVNGVYFFRIETADRMAVRKCVISH